MSHDPVLFELIDHVAVITLNRPEVRNAMNRELRQGLIEGCAASRGGRHQGRRHYRRGPDV